ncbi:MAG: hypothetical protein P8100_06670 [bacterium]
MKIQVTVCGLLLLTSLLYAGGMALPAEINSSRHCTVITVSKGDSIFFGGNDDFIEADSYYWVQPGDSLRYGVIWIGQPDNPQQGVNEKGLAYDANGLPRFDVNPHPERIPVPGGYHNYCMQIMHECATVKEVIDWVNRHQRFPYMHDQMHFADATGDAVIISAGKDGEMVFTRKEAGDGFLVSTNFNVANPANGTGYPCWRFNLAHEILGDLMQQDRPLNHGDLTRVMDAVHLESPSWTIETMVADLVRGVVYIYYFYQYDHPVILNVREELSNPREPGPLSQLFPEEIREEAARRFEKNQLGMKINRYLGIIWPVLILLSLILLFLIKEDKPVRYRFWIPAGVVLGPFALLTRYIISRPGILATGRKMLAEATGSIIPVVISFTAALAALMYSMLSGGASWQFQLILMFGLPSAVGLLYHVAMLAPFSEKAVGRLLLQIIPLVLTTTFIASGSIVAIAMPLVIKTLSISLISQSSLLPLMTWWALVAAGSIPGGLIIMILEKWLIKRGFRSWTAMTEEQERMVIPGWKKLWWWLLTALMILFAGLYALSQLQ